MREPVAPVSGAGGVVVGTDGMIVLPHVTAEPFVLPDSKMASLPTVELANRDRYGDHRRRARRREAEVLSDFSTPAP